MVLALVFASLAIDEGEVVHLRTVGPDGMENEVDVWVVDLDGTLYLRANNREANWLVELRARPEVRLRGEAHGESHFYRAVEVDDGVAKERVDRAMQEKYGYVESLWDWAVDPSESIPVRLDPVAPSEPSP